MNYICKCKKINFLKNEYTYWEDRDVTTDELDIIDFLKNLIVSTVSRYFI